MQGGERGGKGWDRKRAGWDGEAGWDGMGRESVGWEKGGMGKGMGGSGMGKGWDEKRVGWEKGGIRKCCGDDGRDVGREAPGRKNGKNGESAKNDDLCFLATFSATVLVKISCFSINNKFANFSCRACDCFHFSQRKEQEKE